MVLSIALLEIQSDVYHAMLSEPHSLAISDSRLDNRTLANFNVSGALQQLTW